MTEKERQRKIAILKNKIERATTKPDPTGQIIAGLEAEIAKLKEAAK